MRGPNIDSDHYLLKIIISQNLPKIYTKKNKGQTELWNKSNLKNPTKRLEYRRALHAKLKNPFNMENRTSASVSIDSLAFGGNSPVHRRRLRPNRGQLNDDISDDSDTEY
jgi:hypothetical protein